jgi:hypothetical protein
MQAQNLPDLLIIIITCLFLLGSVTFISGIIILLTRSMGSELRAITRQTNQLAQKGLVDELSGLVGNASALLTASSNLIRTTAGIGMLISVLGLLQITAAIGLILYLS